MNIEHYTIQSGDFNTIVYESPHSGHAIPDELQHHYRLVEVSAYRYDTHVDLAAERFLSEAGGFLISSQISRLVVDLNRGVNRVDSRICPNWPEACLHNDGGVIVPFAKVNKRVIQLYDQPLSADEVEYRLTTFWYPYHQRLKQDIDSRINRFGKVLLISLHSTMPRPQHMQGRKPVVYLGTRDKKTCEGPILQIFQRNLVSQGIITISEGYYQGAFTTQAYGEASDVNAIQIELDRRFLKSAAANDQINALVSALQELKLPSRSVSFRKKKKYTIKTFIDPLTGEIQM